MADNEVRTQSAPEKTEYWFRGTPAEFGVIAEDLTRQKIEADPGTSDPYQITQGRERIPGRHIGSLPGPVNPNANPVRVLIHYWNGISGADVEPGGPLSHSGTMTVTATAIPGNGTRLRLGPVTTVIETDNPNLYDTDPTPVLALWDDLLAELVRLDLIGDGETAPAAEPRRPGPKGPRYACYAWLEHMAGQGYKVGPNPENDPMYQLWRKLYEFERKVDPELYLSDAWDNYKGKVEGAAPNAPD